MENKYILFIFCIYFSFCFSQKVHVSYHSDDSCLVVQWIEFYSSSTASVRYGTSSDNLNTIIPANETTSFKECSTIRYTYEAILTNLLPGTFYYYQISTDGINYSESFKIKSSYSDYSNRTLIFSMFGDMTSQPFVNITSIGLLTQNTIDDSQDLVLHSGDLAYNLETNCGNQGDTFMDQVEPISANCVYMFGVGDHERDELGSYKNYKNRFVGQRFAGIGTLNGWNHKYFYWSKTFPGLATIIYINTGAWIDAAAFQTINKQYKWLEQELSNVNRTETPWLFVIGHRSMYCTKTDDNECNSEAATLRNGWDNRLYALEPLMNKYGVDLWHSGHTHHYQRTWPTYQSQPTQTNYNNPQATVYIVSGLGGPPSIDYIDVPNTSYMAFTDFNYIIGYTQYEIINSTTLTITQRNAIDNSKVDTFTIKQENHGPFSN